MPSRAFEATVEVPEEGQGAVVALPFDAREAFGRSRALVVVTFEGRAPFHTTLARFRNRSWITLRRSQLDDLGLTPGDTVTVTVAPDEAPRTVAEPDELAAALSANPEMRLAYDRLSHAHRREYAEWVGAATSAETRQRRAEKALRWIRSGGRKPN
ncbi:YdeI/OmpD-associated family protein [Catenuloplanes sp. NPDC051500]|uniref:YdeI/OmpD-associated family protein n=1 Tax=Catenuloplanes sp. NPDC051500 TaxID=3363959 RepID=UPI0037B2BFB9